MGGDKVSQNFDFILLPLTVYCQRDTGKCSFTCLLPYHVRQWSHHKKNTRKCCSFIRRQSSLSGSTEPVLRSFGWNIKLRSCIIYSQLFRGSFSVVRALIRYILPTQIFKLIQQYPLHGLRISSKNKLKKKKKLFCFKSY